MFSEYTASTTAIVTDLGGQAAIIVLATVGAIIGVALILVGAGYGWRLLKRQVTGKKI